MTTIDVLDPASATDDDLVALHALEAADERDAGIPEALVAPAAHDVLALRHVMPFVHRRWAVARDRELVVGWASCRWKDVPSNRDHVGLSIHVHPSRRREGVGRRLLVGALDAAEEFGARILDAESRVDGPGGAFLTRFGFEARMTSPRNVLKTADVDRELMRSWIERAAERAVDYSLVGWDGPCPDELLGEFVDLAHVMNTAPTEGLDWDDEVFTPEHIREFEATTAERDVDVWVVAARHDPTGGLAGYTTLFHSRHWPAAADQGDTGVRPEHRERGLGRWIKAANILRLFDERPEVEYVTTWNAGSNEPMLAINRTMGFAPLEWWAEWQAEPKHVRDALGSL